MAPHFPWSKSKDGAKKDAPSPATTLLNDEDEQFLERLVSHTEEEGQRPALPPRSRTPELNLIWDEETGTFHTFDNLEDPFAKALVLADTTNNAEQPSSSTAPAAESSTQDKTREAEAEAEADKDKDKDGKDKEKEKKPSRFSRLFHRGGGDKKKAGDTLEVPSATDTPSPSPEKEWADLSRILDKLSLSSSSSSSSSSSTPSDPNAPPAAESKAAVLSREARDLVLTPFLQILKDLANGVPTAADDLVKLLDGRNDILSKSFSKLPSSLQKLVTQLPDKLTSKLAPEILALAAEAQGVDKARLQEKGMKGLMPTSLSDLALTPALIKSLLKTIVNALKTRWPAFAGASALWSIAVVILLFVLWYCHKRGKEEREKTEQEEAEGGEGQEVKGEEVVDAVIEGDAQKGKAVEEETAAGNELVVATVSPPAPAPAPAPAPDLAQIEEGGKK